MQSIADARRGTRGSDDRVSRPAAPGIRSRAALSGPSNHHPGATIVSLPPVATTILLLSLSNVFMTFAWYGHLKALNHKPWLVAALVSWGIALFEYLLQVPANRIGHAVLDVGQLKILQEVITLTVFVPFAVFYLREPLRLDYLWAGLCLLGAVYFMFRPSLGS